MSCAWRSAWCLLIRSIFRQSRRLPSSTRATHPWNDHFLHGVDPTTQHCPSPTWFVLLVWISQRHSHHDSIFSILKRVFLGWQPTLDWICVWVIVYGRREACPNSLETWDKGKGEKRIFDPRMPDLKPNWGVVVTSAGLWWPCGPRPTAVDGDDPCCSETLEMGTEGSGP